MGARTRSTSRTCCRNCIRLECTVRCTACRPCSAPVRRPCRSFKRRGWCAASTTYLRSEVPAEGSRLTKRRTPTTTILNKPSMLPPTPPPPLSQPPPPPPSTPPPIPRYRIIRRPCKSTASPLTARRHWRDGDPSDDASLVRTTFVSARCLIRFVCN